MKYPNIREEEIKNRVAQDYFWLYDCTKIVGNVDFCVCIHQEQNHSLEQESLLWAEAKKVSSDIYNSIVQLILTIGKARTFDKILPPNMLGAFDGEKIAFIPYNEIQEIFYQSDFNWNVKPSDHNTKEFKILRDKVKSILDAKTLLFDYEKDDRELKKFIKNNFVVGKFGVTKTQIDKNNFTVIYSKWLQTVKPTISFNWEYAKDKGIIDGDFYLADLLSQDNVTLKDKLFIVLNNTKYQLNRHVDKFGAFTASEVGFADNQVAHSQFWNRYDRPPKEEYWDYIIKRRDRLVPQDIRERKGSFFTPQIWVELSQKYIAEVFGEDWQDEYYVWDCAAGTGNLLHGLTNKYNIWASTLDKQDVEVMHERIKNGANLLDNHVFQFDFLNDDFSELPKSLQDVINDEDERKKLIIYINPPYAEADNRKGEGRKGVAISLIKEKYSTILGKAKRELFAQFLIRIYREIPSCKIANFSTLKNLQSLNFRVFRKNFRASLEKIFCVPADTFDNVSGQFPIGFFVWDCEKKEIFQEIKANIYNKNGYFLQNKKIATTDNTKLINTWVKTFRYSQEMSIGTIVGVASDFQNQRLVRIGEPFMKVPALNHNWQITNENLIQTSIYLSVRHCIEATWLNDRDQFLYPIDGWQNDTEFQNNCLTYTLFHGQNRISSNQGTNNWIPFTEQEINAKEKFESNFMIQFIKGQIKKEVNNDLFGFSNSRTTELEFSLEAKNVFDAGKELWKYYHSQPNCNVNASLYDIRAHFQGRNKSGKMNNKSDDSTYMELINNLREKLKNLEKKIEPKVYEYEFLRE